jgi:molybdopterin synthase catalytic subunit
VKRVSTRPSDAVDRRPARRSLPQADETLVAERRSPPGENTWVVVTSDELSLSDAVAWATRTDCGAVVTLCGTVRDHSEGRPGVVELEYEAYEPHVTARMADVADVARERFAPVGRVALFHRTGTLRVGDVSVVVVVSAPHRSEAFDAARFCIDAIKSTVPIWKREIWSGGSDWSACTHPIAELPDLAGS